MPAFEDAHPADYGTATAVSGAATLHKHSGKVTTEALATAAGATYTLTLTNQRIFNTSSIVFASVDNGTSTTGSPCVTRVTPTANSLVILIQNVHASAAFNGTLVISFLSPVDVR